MDLIREIDLFYEEFPEHDEFTIKYIKNGVENEGLRFHGCENRDQLRVRLRYLIALLNIESRELMTPSPEDKLRTDLESIGMEPELIEDWVESLQ